MEILGLLFGSEARVKVIRLFLFNADTTYDIDMVCKRSKTNSKIAKKELSILEKAKLIKRKSFYKIITRNKLGKDNDDGRNAPVISFICHCEWRCSSARSNLQLVREIASPSFDYVARQTRATPLRTARNDDWFTP